jgi:hypothetical protein
MTRSARPTLRSGSRPDAPGPLRAPAPGRAGVDLAGRAVETTSASTTATLRPPDWAISRAATSRSAPGGTGAGSSASSRSGVSSAEASRRSIGASPTKRPLSSSTTSVTLTNDRPVSNARTALTRAPGAARGTSETAACPGRVLEASRGANHFGHGIHSRRAGRHCRSPSGDAGTNDAPCPNGSSPPPASMLSRRSRWRAKRSR